MKQEIVAIDSKDNQNGLLGRLARLGGRLPLVPPRGISREEMAAQNIIRRFPRSFSIVPASLEEAEGASTSLEDQIAPAAHSMVESGVIDEDTVVELRPMIPKDALGPGLAERALRAMGIFRETLEEEDICVVPNSHPLMPTARMDAPAQPEAVWGMISHEVDGLQRQLRTGHTDRDAPHDAALVALAQPKYAEHVFGGQLAFGGRPLEEHQPMVLARVGVGARDNVLGPPAIAHH